MREQAMRASAVDTEKHTYIQDAVFLHVTSIAGVGLGKAILVTGREGS
jgi:hypothetical protein